MEKVIIYIIIPQKIIFKNDFKNTGYIKKIYNYKIKEQFNNKNNIKKYGPIKNQNLIKY